MELDLPVDVDERRRHRLIDLGVGVLSTALALALLAVVVAESEPSRDEVVVQLVVGLAACGSLYWRRRWPVALTLVMAVLRALSVMVEVVGLVLVFTVATRRRYPVAIVVGTAFWLPSIVLRLVWPDPEMSYLGAVALSAVVTWAVTGWGMFVRARRQLTAPRAAIAVAEEHNRLVAARHHERARIAREMHDVLGHRLSLLSMHAGALEFRPDAPVDQLAAAAGVVREQAHLALQDLRDVIGVLGEEPDDERRPQPTLADVQGLVAESQRAGMHVSMSVDVEDSTTLTTSVGRSAYRIVQEALTNARKHAPGCVVDVVIAGAPGPGLTIDVSNPSLATATAVGAGARGLVGLSERAGSIGGRVAHGVGPDGVFRLTAWLPWPA